MKTYLKWVDTNTTGNRYDLTPLFANAEAYASLIDDLVIQFSDMSIDLVAGIDALGFVLGAAIAQKMGLGFLAIRKGGKLPVDVDRIEFRDYSGEIKELEIRQDVLLSGMRVLIVDEWIETGAQMSAAIQLLEGRGGIIAGIATINMDENELTRSIREKYPVFSVWEEIEE